MNKNKLLRIFTKINYYTTVIHEGSVDMIKAFSEKGVKNTYPAKYSPNITHGWGMNREMSRVTVTRYNMINHRAKWREYRYIDPKNLIKIMVNQIVDKFEGQEFIPIAEDKKYHSFAIRFIEGFIESRFKILKKLIKPKRFYGCYEYEFKTIIGIKQ